MMKKFILTSLLLSPFISFMSFADTDVPAKITININNEDLGLTEDTSITDEKKFKKNGIEFEINNINSNDGKIRIPTPSQNSMINNFYIYNCLINYFVF